MPFFYTNKKDYNYIYLKIINNNNILFKIFLCFPMTKFENILEIDFLVFQNLKLTKLTGYRSLAYRYKYFIFFQ